MSDCSKEAGECGHNHSHDHDHDSPEKGIEYSLYKYIDSSKVSCLNESNSGSAVKIFKSWDQRFDTTKFLESDTDDQLIIFVPFTGVVKIKSIKIIGPEGDSHPKNLKIFGNRDDIDFDNVDDCVPLQELELSPDPTGRLDYPTRVTKFQNLHSITMFFSSSYGADISKIFYIGLAGEFAQ
eukprot:Ihof_evm2s254 gene=Ihof_evmTU2s254